MKMFPIRRSIRYFESKLAFSVGPSDVHDMLQEHEEVNIIDVRRTEDYLQGHIPHSLNVPKEQWESLVGLERDKTNIIYCYSQQCHLATRACLEFAKRGFRVREMEGGWKAWREYGYEAEGEEPARKAA